jgi:2-keto-4-pentenoate hydratase/2-oxohepta-3-ene-1,7-dioic acid hydratase in catechol pathway
VHWLRFRHGDTEYTAYLDGGRACAVTGDIYSGRWRDTGRSFALNEAELLPPCQPTKIICVGLNYRDHAEEFNMAVPEQPVLFFKPPSSLLAHGGTIVYPDGVRRLDYEAELAVVMGKKTRKVKSEEAREYIFGFTCANDVTARDLQKTDLQWTRAKSYDTFCPLGPWIVTGLDDRDLGVSLRLNGETRQSSQTSRLVFNVPHLVAYISAIMTLEPGDVILTGTPSGVGPLSRGDSVTVCLENIGDLTNPVA